MRARVAPRRRGARCRDGRIEADARIRLAHQVPDAEKAAQADYVLDNSGDIAALRAQVEALWPRLHGREQQIRAELVFYNKR